MIYMSEATEVQNNLVRLVIQLGYANLLTSYRQSRAIVEPFTKDDVFVADIVNKTNDASYRQNPSTEIIDGKQRKQDTQLLMRVKNNND